MEWQKEDYIISTDKTKVEGPYAHRFLCQSDWAACISQEVVQRSVNGSNCFALYEREQQIGFARMITDEATSPIAAQLSYPSFQELRRILPCTRDAHCLYRQFGFTPLPTLDLDAATPSRCL